MKSRAGRPFIHASARRSSAMRVADMNIDEHMLDSGLYGA